MNLKSNIKIAEKVIKEQLANKEDEIDKVKIYKEAYEFLQTQMENEHTNQIIKLNQRISESISELQVKNAWPQLNSISKHALTACIASIQKNETKEIIMRNHLKILEFKQFILNSGKNEFIDFLTEEAKEKFFNMSNKNNKDNEND